MQEDRLRDMLVALGVRREEIRKGTDNWLQCRCPLAPWTHGEGRDSHPSFTVSIQPNKTSFYNCFGCSPSPATTMSLIQRVWIVTGQYPKKAAAIVGRHEIFKNGTKPQTFIDEPEYEEYPDPLPDFVLREYPLLLKTRTSAARESVRWLINRGAKVESIRRYGVRFDPESGAIVFPYTNPIGDVFGLTVRLVDEKRHFHVTPELAGFPDIEFPSVKKTGAWFGLNLLDQTKPVYLVEGEVDALRMSALGLRNTVAAGGSKVTPEQVSEIRAYRVFLGFDTDKEGYRAIRKVGRLLQDHCLLYVLNWSRHGKDPGDLPDRAALIKVLKERITFDEFLDL